MGLNYQREHLRPQARIHYRIMNGGAVVNVVPDYARIWTRVRHSTAEEVRETYTRVQEIARGASIMANVDYKITLVSGLHEVIPNRTGGNTLQANLEALGPLEYSDEEIAFAHGIQAATDKPQTGIDGKVYPLRETAEYPSGGSTDVGDVSWPVPEIRLGVTTAPEDTPWHSWAVVACGGMSIGHKGMLRAAELLAVTAVDLYQSPELRAAARDLAQVPVSHADVATLSRIADGTLSPLEGPMNEEAFHRVLDERRLDAGSRRARDARTTTDARTILDDPAIQAVCIATPTHQHRELAETALQAGKHVYCEAPLAHTLDDARAIARAARDASEELVGS